MSAASLASASCPTCGHDQPYRHCPDCAPARRPATCPACKGSGLTLAVVPADDEFPYFYSGLAYRLCDCPAGERLRAADRDHDLADCLDRDDVPCGGPVWAPRMAGGCEPLGISVADLEV